MAIYVLSDHVTRDGESVFHEATAEEDWIDAERIAAIRKPLWEGLEIRSTAIDTRCARRTMNFINGVKQGRTLIQ